MENTSEAVSRYGFQYVMEVGLSQPIMCVNLEN